MSSEITIARPMVFAHAGTAYANSTQVAEFFEKRHDHVLRDIRGLLHFGDTPSDWFVATNYVNDQNGESYPAYNLTRDGFTLVAMGFTGSKALGFKIDYIEAFNAMERTLSRQTPVPVVAKPRVSGSLVRETRKLLDFAEANWRLSPASQQAFAASLFKQVGIDLPAPVVAEKHYSTTELAERFDLSPNKFGRLVKHLKTAANGEWRLTTAPSGKQVEVYVWNQRGCDAVTVLLDDDTTVALADDTIVPFDVGERGSRR